MIYKINPLKQFIVSLCLLIVSYVNAQLELDAEIRPRYENRHGFKTIFPKGEDAASFVSQRTRLGAYYSTEKLIAR